MKKVLAILLAVAMVMALAACGAKTEEDTTVAPETEATEVETTEATTEATTAAEPVTDENGEVVTDANGEAVTLAPETTEAPKAPETTAEILAYYNANINAAYDAKVGFDKERSTDNEKMDAKGLVNTSAIKDLIYQFMGIGSANKYTESVAKGKWDSDSLKHFLRKSTLTEADLTNAAITSDGKNYTIVFDVKSGSSKGGKEGNPNNSPIDKCGICVGDTDKGCFDHKTGPVIYDAIDDVYGSALIKENTSNCKVTAVFDIATGRIVTLTVQFDISCYIDVGIAGSGTATGTSHIVYKNFKY